MRSASTEELPVAMLPKGPACTSAGVPSSVWSRFGLTRLPKDRRHRARRPQVLERSPARRRASTRPRSGAAGPPGRAGTSTSASRAMTSDAAVMSNPLWRGTPSSRPPRPTTMLRRARSLTSRTRGHVIDGGSIPSGLRWYSELSTIAASRLCAAVTAWKSPVRCRFMQLHRDDLAVPAPGRSSLDAEGRAHRRLPERDRRPSPDAARTPGRGPRWWSSCPRRGVSG